MMEKKLQRIDFEIDSKTAINSEALYDLGLIKFKDQNGNITTIKSFEEFDKAMSDPNSTFVLG